MKVATILEDPSVKEADMHLYATHTKHFPVRGAGFVSVQDPSSPPTIVIDGISAANYKVQVRRGNFVVVGGGGGGCGVSLLMLSLVFLLILGLLILFLFL